MLRSAPDVRDRVLAADVVVTIDPGKRSLGFAAVKARRLVRSTLVAPSPLAARIGPISALADGVAREVLELTLPGETVAVVVEGMHVYVGGRGKARPADLLALALVGGAVIGRLSGLPHRALVCEQIVDAAAWKGQVPRDVLHARIVERSGGEQAFWSLSTITKPNRKTEHADITHAIALAEWATHLTLV